MFSIDYNLPPEERAARAERELERLENQLAGACVRYQGQLASIADVINQELRETGGCPPLMECNGNVATIIRAIRILGDRIKNNQGWDSDISAISQKERIKSQLLRIIDHHVRKADPPTRRMQCLLDDLKAIVDT